jgi:hypothetical protein
MKASSAREPGDVHEEDRHLLALAFERDARRQDLLGEVPWSVGTRRARPKIGRSRALKVDNGRRLGKRGAAAAAELVGGVVGEAAAGAHLA